MRLVKLNVQPLLLSPCLWSDAPCSAIAAVAAVLAAAGAALVAAA